MPVHALAARMSAASAARVASGTGSPEKIQGSAVQTPCPSTAAEMSTRVTLVTWSARGVGHGAGDRRFSAPSTTCAAA